MRQINLMGGRTLIECFRCIKQREAQREIAYCIEREASSVAPQRTVLLREASPGAAAVCIYCNHMFRFEYLLDCADRWFRYGRVAGPLTEVPVVPLRRRATDQEEEQL